MAHPMVDDEKTLKPKFLCFSLDMTLPKRRERRSVSQSPAPSMELLPMMINMDFATKKASIEEHEISELAVCR